MTDANPATIAALEIFETYRLDQPETPQVQSRLKISVNLEILNAAQANGCEPEAIKAALIKICTEQNIKLF